MNKLWLNVQVGSQFQSQWQQLKCSSSRLLIILRLQSIPTIIKSEGIRAAITSEICLSLCPELLWLSRRGYKHVSCAQLSQISSDLIDFGQRTNHVYSDLQILFSTSDISNAPIAI